MRGAGLCRINHIVLFDENARLTWKSCIIITIQSRKRTCSAGMRKLWARSKAVWCKSIDIKARRWLGQVSFCITLNRGYEITYRKLKSYVFNHLQGNIPAKSVICKVSPTLREWDIINALRFSWMNGWLIGLWCKNTKIRKLSLMAFKSPLLYWPFGLC